MRFRFWQKKPESGALYLKRREIFKKVYRINILDAFKNLLSCFHTFDVRRPLDDLDLETSPAGSEFGALGLTGDA